MPFTFTASASPFFEETLSVTAVNQSRGEDELIVYTPAFGATTATNAYGYEVAVDQDGTMISMGGNNTAIPPKGFVLSGHGSMADYLRQTVIPGMTITFDAAQSVVHLHYRVDGIQKSMNASIAATQKAINHAKAAFVYVDYDAVQKAFDDVKTKFTAALTAHKNGGNDPAFEEKCAVLLRTLTTIRNGLCDSYPVQYRGVWVRPSQRSAAEVKAYVKTLHDAGINTVSVEGCFANTVIMNVPKDSLFEKNPAFSYDVLQAYIDACKEYNMECHLWMPVFKVGNDYDGDPSRNILSKRPEWASLDQHGSAGNDSGFAMIDPANTEARAYLTDFYKYIVENYEIHCLELDYIRYYVTSSEYDYGYTEAAFEGFEAQYHYGVTPTYNRKSFYWDEWVQYRRDQVTAMVREIRDMLDDTNSEVLLSADVACPASHANDNVYQQYDAWLDEKLLDILHPMAYGDGFEKDIRDAVQKAGDRCMVVTGLGVQSHSLGATEMERQARADAMLGAYGEFYFEASSFLKDNADKALGETIYRTPAAAPFFYGSGSMRTLLDYMQGRVQNVLLPHGGVTAAQAAALTDAISSLRSAVYGTDISAAQLQTLYDTIDTVKNDAARKVLYADLYRIEQIVCVKHDLLRHQLAVPYPINYNSKKAFTIMVINVILTAVAVIGSASVLIKNRRSEKGLSE